MKPGLPVALALALAAGPVGFALPPGAAWAQAAAPESVAPAPATTAPAPAGPTPAPSEAPAGIAAPPAEGVPEALPAEESVPPTPVPAEAAPAPEGTPQEPPAEAAPAPAPEPAAPVDWSKVANPVPADADSIERGRKLYLSKALCAVCHGELGDGFGPVRVQFNPFPNAFLDPEWQKSFTDGQLMGVLREGKFGTGMIRIVPDFLTEAEAWDVINYVRTFSGKTTEAYVRARAEAEKAKAEERKKIEEKTR